MLTETEQGGVYAVMLGFLVLFFSFSLKFMSLGILYSVLQMYSVLKLKKGSCRYTWSLLLGDSKFLLLSTFFIHQCFELSLFSFFTDFVFIVSYFFSVSVSTWSSLDT